MHDILVALVPVLAMLIAQTATLIGVHLTQQAQERRDALAHARAQSGARTDRLRQAYLALLQGADALTGVYTVRRLEEDQGLPIASMASSTRRGWHDSLWAPDCAASALLGEAQRVIRLEEDGADVRMLCPSWVLAMDHDRSFLEDAENDWLAFSCGRMGSLQWWEEEFAPSASRVKRSCGRGWQS